MSEFDSTILSNHPFHPFLFIFRFALKKMSLDDDDKRLDDWCWRDKTASRAWSRRIRQKEW